MHKFMANIVCGKGDNDGMVINVELLMLWAMHNYQKVNLGYFMIKHFYKLARRSKRNNSP